MQPPSALQGSTRIAVVAHDAPAIARPSEPLPAVVRARPTRARRERVPPLPADRRRDLSRDAAAPRARDLPARRRSRPRSCARPASSTSSRCRRRTVAPASRSHRPQAPIARRGRRAAAARQVRAATRPVVGEDDVRRTSTSRRSTSRTGDHTDHMDTRDRRLHVPARHRDPERRRRLRRVRRHRRPRATRCGCPASTAPRVRRSTSATPTSSSAVISSTRPRRSAVR